MFLFKNRRNPIVKNILNGVKSYDYSNTLIQVQEILEEFKADPILKALGSGMLTFLKSKYLRLAIQNSSAISIRTLAELTSLTENQVFLFVLNEIKANSLDVKIDNIEKIIYSNSNDKLKETLKLTVDSVQNSYLSTFKKQSM